MSEGDGAGTGKDACSGTCKVARLMAGTYKHGEEEARLATQGVAGMDAQAAVSGSAQVGASFAECPSRAACDDSGAYKVEISRLAQSF